MSFQTIGDAAEDPVFQRRCKGSFIAMASAILAAPLNSNAVNSTKGDLTTEACKNLALNFCKGTNLFTDEALASLMLLNVDVAADPLGSAEGPSEGAIQYQTKEIWLDLVEIG